jgi:hypothetical protein
MGEVERGVRRRLAIGAAAAALLAGTYLAVDISRGGSGRADRRAFFADVARRLEIDPHAFTGWGSGRAGVAPDLEQRIRERLEQAPRSLPLDPSLLRYPDRSTSVQAAADYLGLPRWQVRAQLRSGASLADIAAAQGKSVTRLELTIIAETRLRLEATTNLRGVERQRLLDRLIGRIDEIVRRDGRPAGWGANGGP